MTGTLNVAFNGEVNNEQTLPSNKSTPKETMIIMRDGDTLQTQMSTDGARAIAELSPRITVTFYNVSKVISVPAKMIDPSSKERFIQRTLLDNVSGQIHPGQIVALMGPSGNSIEYLVVVFLHVDIFREWKDNFTEHIIWSSIEWCFW
jgi:hypothetical protein